MDTWLQALAVLRGRDLHLRRLPRLPRPAEPEPRPGSPPSSPAAGGCCPITLGPQASCQPRFPRYNDDLKISPNAGRDGFADGPAAGRAEADKAVAPTRWRWASCRAARSGTTSRRFDHSNTRCRESALAFLSSLDRQLHEPGLRLRRLLQRRLGHQGARRRARRAARPASRCPTGSGSPAGTASRTPRRRTSARTAGVPGGRVKQYKGGHNETWGGVTINIDRNFLDLGRGSVAVPEGTAAASTRLDYRQYPTLARAAAQPTRKVKALQCLLQERGLYAGSSRRTTTPRRSPRSSAWQADRGFRRGHVVTRATGSALLIAQERLRAEDRLHRLRCAGCSARSTRPAPTPLRATGIFDARTEAACAPTSAASASPATGIATTGRPGSELQRGPGVSLRSADGRTDQQRDAGEGGDGDDAADAPAGGGAAASTPRARRAGRRCRGGSASGRRAGRGARRTGRSRPS